MINAEEAKKIVAEVRKSCSGIETGKICLKIEALAKEGRTGFNHVGILDRATIEELKSLGFKVGKTVIDDREGDITSITWL